MLSDPHARLVVSWTHLLCLTVLFERIQYFFSWDIHSMSQRQIVAAISAGLQQQHNVDRMEADDIATEILGCRACMPDYLRLPMWIATLLFDVLGLFSGGRRFHAKDAAGRVAQLNSWKHSSVGACRNFIRFYESLFLLIALQEEVS
jgi:hypothetical protein